MISPSIEKNPRLFDSLKLGPIALRNRSIRAAAFEGMSQQHQISKSLLDYHRAIAAGGIGMTTLAYVAIDRSGLSFDHQLFMSSDIVADLKKLCETVHRENAAISIQLGHAGNMAKKNITGTTPISASSQINWYGPTFPREASKHDIQNIISSFKNAANIAYQAGFDAVEIHAGHGYLLSQFLSPYTNIRNDEYGGNLDNRMRLLVEVIQSIIDLVGHKMAVLVKMNMNDGFKQGLTIEDALKVGIKLEKLGVHAIIPSAGFVSKTPMHIMKGSMPLNVLAADMKFPENFLVTLFGKQMIPSESFHPLFFKETALIFRQNLKLPLIYIGGILSGESIEEILSEGFDGVAIARALIAEPNFIQLIQKNNYYKSLCNSCNQCVASIYSGSITCPLNHTLAKK